MFVSAAAAPSTAGAHCEECDGCVSIAATSMCLSRTTPAPSWFAEWTGRGPDSVMRAPAHTSRSHDDREMMARRPEVSALRLPEIDFPRRQVTGPTDLLVHGSDNERPETT